MSAAGRSAARYAEAGWLLVAVWAALLFQVIAQRSFDFPRVMWLLVLLPWLGLAVLVAARGMPLPRVPLLVAAAVVGSYALSTALSIAPGISLWGSRFNAEGLAAALGYAGVFLAVALLTRRVEQARRLVDVVLLTSAPVSLYGVVQYFGLDPLAAAMSQQIAGGRIVASLGNPILAGGYAAIVVPLTIARLVEAWRGSTRGGDGRARGAGGTVAGSAAGRRPGAPAGLGTAGDSAALGSLGSAVAFVAAVVAGLAVFLWLAARGPMLWWAAPAVLGLFLWALLAARRPLERRAALVGYGALLLLQLALFVLARSRGPFVALPVALGVTLFLLAQSRRTRLGLIAAGVVGALIVLGLVVAPALRGEVGTVSSRWLIWQGVADLALGAHPGVPPDPLAPLRPLVGRGPETLAMAYEWVATAEARRAEPFRISRAHDEPLDVLATRGFIGLASWLFTLGAVGWSAWRACRQGGPAAAAIAGAAGALTAHVVTHLFEPTDPALALHFWLLAGLVVSAAGGLGAGGAVTAAADGRRAGGLRGRDPRSSESNVDAPAPEADLLERPGWRAGVALGGGALAIALLAVANVGFDVVGLLLVVWVALAPPALAGGLAAPRWRVVLPAGLVALLLASVPARRFEADAFSKFGVDAARRGDVVGAVELTREAVALAPDDELLRSNVARALAAAANGAPDRPPRQGFQASWALIEQLPADAVRSLSKRELLLLAAAALEEAVARAPAEPDNRLNLAIVHRALGDLGQPGHHELARAQLRVLVEMAPTQELYARQLGELGG